MKYKFFIALITLFSIKHNAKSQDVDWYQLIGKPYAAKEVYSVLHPLEQDSMVELFLPNSGPFYSLLFINKGVRVNFNFNLIVSSILFYDSGYRYQEFKDKLPHNLKWGTKMSEFVKIASQFNQQFNNKYKFLLPEENYTTTVYFKNADLNLVKIEIDENYLLKQDSQYFNYSLNRLIPNGICIEGNCIETYGTMQWGDIKHQIEYSGRWFYQMPHFNGFYSDYLGNSYKGNFRMGYTWGEGEMKYANGNQYKGDFIMGVRQGYGECQFINGSVYNGTWLNDEFEGKGTLTRGAHFKYVGEFKNNAFNGKGKLKSQLGDYEGFFKDNKPHGKGILTLADGSMLLGVWINGKKEGEFKLVLPDGEEEIKHYENDTEISK